MNAYEIADQLKTTRITSIPLRVAAYSRVSTESLEQKTSIVNQTESHREFIEENPAWTFAGEYIDEGISGLSVKKRDEFNRMIRDAEEGKFDLIITKSVTRFARNTLDSLKFTRDLKACGVGVWFITDNILTFDSDSELRLSIMSTIAQEESVKKSEAVRAGLQQAIKRGTVFGFDNMWGYRKKNGKLVIDEKEAPIVQTIFEMYATDRYSMNQIEQVLFDRGYRNRKGNRISHATMSKMIQNPKYKGYFVGHKVRTVDLFTKKFIMLPEEEWVMMKDETIVPAIVSEELWEAANRVLERRSKDVKNRQNQCTHPNLMTGKMICAHCGKPYHRKASGDKRGNTANSAWVCSGKIKNGAKSCPSRYIYEDEIREMLFVLFQETQFDVDAYMKKYIEIFSQTLNRDETSQRRLEVSAEIEEIKKKKTKLLGYNVEGKITDDEFLEMKDALTQEQKEKEKELVRLEDAIFSQKQVERRLTEVQQALTKMKYIKSSDMIDDVFVRNYIDRIDVEMEGKTPKLSVRLMTGKVVDKALYDLRPGHMTKRLIEQAERAMSNQG